MNSSAQSFGVVRAAGCYWMSNCCRMLFVLLESLQVFLVLNSWCGCGELCLIGIRCL